MPQTVLISGAGIAGPALAYWLKRFGITPTIVERSPHMRDEGYIIDFWGCGFDVLERMGLRSTLEHEGYDVREVRLVNAAGKRSGGFGARVFRDLTGNRYTSLLRGDLSSILHRAIEGNVDVRFGDSIREFEQHSHGVTVVFERGGSRRFDAVIGADGLHSRVRDLLFGAEGKYERYLGYIAAAFALDGYSPRDEGVYVSHSAPGRQVARFAMRDDRTMFLCVAADNDTSVFDRRDAAEQKEYLRRRFANLEWECPRILDALQGERDIYFDRVSQIRLPRWSKGRVALLGDAAFAPSLLAGQGASLAITGAYVLAGELAHSANPEEAFVRYENRLRSLMLRKQESAVGTGRAFAPKTRVGLEFRNLATRALALPWLAKLALGPSLRDDFALPEYPGLRTRAPSLAEPERTAQH